jgi:hypothetical protein
LTKLRKKQRFEDYDSDIRDASSDFDIIDLTEDSKDDEEELYVGEDPYLLLQIWIEIPTRISL